MQKYFKYKLGTYCPKLTKKIIAALSGPNQNQAIRDWSLITGKGWALQNGRRRGKLSFTPMKMGGGKSYSHAEGGGDKKSLGSFSTET